jgi:hypothetical protein
MSQILELRDSVYAALKRAAEAKGTTPEAWIEARLPVEANIPPEAKSLADLLEGRIGRIAGKGLGTSGESFADHLVEKKRQGRL